MAGFSGFMAGGIAEGFQNQMKIQDAAEFNRRRLQLAQQAEQNAQQRELYTRVDKIAADAWGHVEDTVNAFRNAGHTTQEAAVAATPILRTIIDMKQRARMTDAEAVYTAQFGALLARPSQAQNERALAQAKDPYKSQIESLTVQQKQQEIDAAKREAAMSGLNPDLDTATQLGGKQSPQDPGEAFLSKFPDNVKQQIKDIAAYKLNPNTFSTRIPKGMTESPRQIMVGNAEQYAAATGGSYDQAQYGARSKAVSNFAGGQEARNVKSFNVVVSHLDVLKDAAVALNNGDKQAFNRVKNLVASATGNPAPTNFDAVKGLVADELVKAVTGGAGALGDREGIAATVNAANSPAQLLGVIQQYQHLAAGQLAGLRTQYQSTTGLNDFDKFLDKRTKDFFGIDAGTDSSAKDVGRVPAGWSIQRISQ